MSRKTLSTAHGSENREKPRCNTARGPCKAITPTHHAAPSAFGIPLAGPTLLTIKESASAIGFKRDFMERMIEEGRIEAHRPPNRERSHTRITRRSLVAFMAQTATYKSDDLLPAPFYVVGTLSDAQRETLLARMQKGGRRG